MGSPGAEIEDAGMNQSTIKGADSGIVILSIELITRTKIAMQSMFSDRSQFYWVYNAHNIDQENT
jgi:DUF971 family protein